MLEYCPSSRCDKVRQVWHRDEQNTHTYACGGTRCVCNPFYVLPLRHISQFMCAVCILVPHSQVSHLASKQATSQAGQTRRKLTRNATNDLHFVARHTRHHHLCPHHKLYHSLTNHHQTAPHHTINTTTPRRHDTTTPRHHTTTRHHNTTTPRHHNTTTPRHHHKTPRTCGLIYHGISLIDTHSSPLNHPNPQRKIDVIISVIRNIRIVERAACFAGNQQ